MKMTPIRWIYPLNIKELAKYLHKQNIDIAPHALEWSKCAQDIADALGEEGRESFHLIASVWPYYEFRDSDLCYNRALRKSEDDKTCTYIRYACKRLGVVLDRFQCGAPVPLRLKNKKIKKKTQMVDINNFKNSLLPSNDSIMFKSNLTDLLSRLYGETQVRKVIDDYCIGFTSVLHHDFSGYVIYYYIDDNFNLINAKKIIYNPDGHRNKQFNPILMFPRNPLCLFGLHLIDQKDKIGIVESEKSCLIMSMEMPEITWMAVGGLSNFNETLLAPIKGKKIIAYPDLDIKTDKRTHKSFTHKQWSDVAIRLCHNGYDISVSDFLEENCNSYHRIQKYDIADFFLADKLVKFQNPSYYEKN